MTTAKRWEKRGHTNGWIEYRPGERTTEEADEIFSMLAKRRVSGLVSTKATIANLLESAYMQGFEDAVATASRAGALPDEGK